MDKQKLKEQWLEEESIAHIKGWDFSHIRDRYEEEDTLPWDYKSMIKQYLKPEHIILDLDTGGGEFLLSLDHPYKQCFATEGYPPNVELCKETLLPLGINFKEAQPELFLPFDDESVDIVLNRHGDYNVNEIKRVLKPGGVYISQQVGAENDRDLVSLLLDPVPPLPFPHQYLNTKQKLFEQAGFDILQSGECYRPIRFYDVGALVWFARIIEWEFIDFSVDTSIERLYTAQEIIDTKKVIEGTIHRFYIVAKK